MFTGLIKDVGKIAYLETEAKTQYKTSRITICTRLPSSDIEIGSSVACNGICLTVTKKGKVITQIEDYDNYFEVFLSPETISHTSALLWRVGDAVNLEPSLKAGDAIGGHFVSGHIDAIADVINIEKNAEAKKITISMNDAIAPFIAPKGSVTLDGISLTVNNVKQKFFDVMIIPHTDKMTSWKYLKIKDKVNVEIDILARYIARYASFFKNHTEA